MDDLKYEIYTALKHKARGKWDEGKWREAVGIIDGVGRTHSNLIEEPEDKALREGTCDRARTVPYHSCTEGLTPCTQPHTPH